MTRKKLRVAFVDYVLDPRQPGRSGLSDVVWDMATELVNQGHEAHIVASYHTETYPDPRVIVHSFPTPPIGYRNLAGQLWILKRAAATVKMLRPDVVHTPEYVSTAVLASLGVKAPMVLTVPGNIFERIERGNPYDRLYTRVLKWAARVSARRCHTVIAISREMKIWWERTGSEPARTPWIPLGVDPERFYQVADAKESLKLAKDSPFLLYVGRFSKEKGLLDLLDALAQIKPELDTKKVQITLIGRGPLETEIRQRLALNGLTMVSVHPWVPSSELSTWYSAADALLLPSHSEGFSRTIPEAMICGTPVVGTKITGTEDHILEGRNGYLAPPQDPQSLARVLALVLENPTILQTMRRHTLGYARDKLTWPHIMERVIREAYLPSLYNRSAPSKPTYERRITS